MSAPQQQAGTTVGEVTLGGVPYPLALGPNGLPTPIDVAPQVAFPDAIILGDSSQRSDQRVASVIQSDWQGGIGTLDYIEAQGVTTVRDSFADTRYAGVIASTRLMSQYYDTLPGSPLAAGRHIEFFHGSLSGRLLAWTRFQVAHRWTNPGWTALGTWLVRGFGRFRNNAVFATDIGVYFSVDGETWAVAGTAAATWGIAQHDNKVWTFFAGGVGEYILYSATELVAATTWTLQAPLYLQYGETISQLIDWRNARGARALYVLTNQRIMGYDDDDKEFTTFYDFSDLVLPTGARMPWGYVWRNNDDLFVTFYDTDGNNFADVVVHFNGSVIEVLAPNKLGGILPANQFRILFLTGSVDELFALCGSTSNASPTTAGRVLAMNPQQGWHTVMASTASNPIVGGGYANGTLYTVRQAGEVHGYYRIGANGNILTLPADAGRTYETIAQTVESATLDAGTPGITKRLLWVRIACVTPDATLGSVYGLPGGATVKVEYRVDNGPWTQLTDVKVNGVVTALAGGVLNSAVTFPATLPLGGELGVSCNRWAWRLTLTRGTSATIPTLVSQVGWHYVRQPEVRYSYRARVDLRDETWGGSSLPQFGGRTAAQLRAALLDWPGNGLTNFAYGQGASRVAIAAVDVVARPVESSLVGPGLYDVVVRDLTTPDSGV